MKKLYKILLGFLYSIIFTTFISASSIKDSLSAWNSFKEIRLQYETDQAGKVDGFIDLHLDNAIGFIRTSSKANRELVAVFRRELPIIIASTPLSRLDEVNEVFSALGAAISEEGAIASYFVGDLFRAEQLAKKYPDRTRGAYSMRVAYLSLYAAWLKSESSEDMKVLEKIKSRHLMIFKFDDNFTNKELKIRSNIVGNGLGMGSSGKTYEYFIEWIKSSGNQ